MLPQLSTPAYSKANIYAKIDNSAHGFAIDWLPLPVPATSKDASKLAPITAAEAQRIVDAAVAKAKAAKGVPAPVQAAGRR